MPEERYRISYQGKVAQGRNVEEVERNLMEQVSETLQQKITCPKCRFRQEKTEESRQCGIIISKYLRNLENEEETPHVTPRRARPLYFAVSKAKLIVLSLVTLRLYEIYWFYKNWKLVKRRTGQNIRPSWRALFAVFFCHSLFKSVQESAISHDCRSSVSPGWLTFLYVALTVAWRLSDPYGLVSLLTFLPLLPVQTAINEINARAAFTAQRDMGHSLQDVLWT